MKIEIFGPGCPRCHQLEKVVKDAISELKILADMEKISDITKIVDAGVMQTPGLRINGKMTSAGRIPRSEEIKKWLAEEK